MQAPKWKFRYRTIDIPITAIGRTVPAGNNKGVEDKSVSRKQDVEGSRSSLAKYVHSPQHDKSCSGAKQKILLVDDDEMIRRAVSLILASTYETIVAASAEDAIQLLEGSEHQIQCVITDYSLPGCSGVELAEKIGQRRSGIPVILISGFLKRTLWIPTASLRFCQNRLHGPRCLRLLKRQSTIIRGICKLLHRDQTALLV